MKIRWYTQMQEKKYIDILIKKMWKFYYFLNYIRGEMSIKKIGNKISGNMIVPWKMLYTIYIYI